MVFEGCKMKKQKVTVKIYGEEYPMITDGSPAYLEKLAAYVDNIMQDISSRSPSLPDRRVAVLAALEISDEYSKLKKDYEDMVKLFEEK